MMPIPEDKVVHMKKSPNPSRNARTLRPVLLMGIVAACLTLACLLSGCSVVTDEGDGSLDDALNSLDSAQQDLQDAAQVTEDALNLVFDGGLPDDLVAHLDSFGKDMQSAVVIDAQTGKVINQVDDPARVTKVASKINLVEMVSSHPDSSTAEYQISFSQNETIKLGQSADDVKQVEALTITTYQDSNIIELHVPMLKSLDTFGFEATPEFVEALRSLAR